MENEVDQEKLDFDYESLSYDKDKSTDILGLIAQDQDVTEDDVLNDLGKYFSQYGNDLKHVEENFKPFIAKPGFETPGSLMQTGLNTVDGVLNVVMDVPKGAGIIGGAVLNEFNSLSFLHDEDEQELIDAKPSAILGLLSNVLEVAGEDNYFAKKDRELESLISNGKVGGDAYTDEDYNRFNVLISQREQLKEQLKDFELSPENYSEWVGVGTQLRRVNKKINTWKRTISKKTNWGITNTVNDFNLAAVEFRSNLAQLSEKESVKFHNQLAGGIGSFIGIFGTAMASKVVGKFALGKGKTFDGKFSFKTPVTEAEKLAKRVEKTDDILAILASKGSALPTGTTLRTLEKELGKDGLHKLVTKALYNEQIANAVSLDFAKMNIANTTKTIFNSSMASMMASEGFTTFVQSQGLQDGDDLSGAYGMAALYGVLGSYMERLGFERMLTPKVMKNLGQNPKLVGLGMDFAADPKKALGPLADKLMGIGGAGITEGITEQGQRFLSDVLTVMNTTNTYDDLIKQYGEILEGDPNAFKPELLMDFYIGAIIGSVVKTTTALSKSDKPMESATGGLLREQRVFLDKMEEKRKLEKEKKKADKKADEDTLRIRDEIDADSVRDISNRKEINSQSINVANNIIGKLNVINFENLLRKAKKEDLEGGVPLSIIIDAYKGKPGFDYFIDDKNPKKFWFYDKTHLYDDVDRGEFAIRLNERVIGLQNEIKNDEVELDEIKERQDLREAERVRIEASKTAEGVVGEEMAEEGEVSTFDELYEFNVNQVKQLEELVMGSDIMKTVSRFIQDTEPDQVAEEVIGMITKHDLVDGEIHTPTETHTGVQAYLNKLPDTLRDNVKQMLRTYLDSTTNNRALEVSFNEEYSNLPLDQRIGSVLEPTSTRVIIPNGIALAQDGTLRFGGEVVSGFDNGVPTPQETIDLENQKGNFDLTKAEDVVSLTVSPDSIAELKEAMLSRKPQKTKGLKWPISPAKRAVFRGSLEEITTGQPQSQIDETEKHVKIEPVDINKLQGLPKEEAKQDVNVKQEVNNIKSQPVGTRGSAINNLKNTVSEEQSAEVDAEVQDSLDGIPEITYNEEAEAAIALTEDFTGEPVTIVYTTTEENVNFQRKPDAQAYFEKATNTVYVNKSRVKTAKQLEIVMKHEIIGHRRLLQ